MELGRPRRQDGERVRKLRDPRGEHVGGEEALRWMVEIWDKEAQEAYGEKLYIASLAVVTEKDKIRLTQRTKSR